MKMSDVACKNCEHFHRLEMADRSMKSCCTLFVEFENKGYASKVVETVDNDKCEMFTQK